MPRYKRIQPVSYTHLDVYKRQDETWAHYHQPETKRASKEWRHRSSPKPKNFRTQPSAEKVMLTLFWDKKGVILETLHGQESNSDQCYLWRSDQESTSTCDQE